MFGDDTLPLADVNTRERNEEIGSLVGNIVNEIFGRTWGY